MGILKTLPATLEDLYRFSSEQRLYAILDTCDAPDVREKTKEIGPTNAICLYRGKLEPELEEIAPYLVRVSGELLSWLSRDVWNEPWGIFVIASIGSGPLRKHFRRFLMVQDSDGEPMYFRFYDPRVLPAFLPSCDEEAIREFFGPVAALGFVQDGHIVIAYTPIKE